MRVAIIAPTNFLNKYCCRTGMQLCYASQLLIDSKYEEFYRNRRKAGDIVIMDSSPKVPRELMDPKSFWAAYWKVQPQYIVMPSSDYALGKTVATAKEYYTTYKGMCKTVGVLQGANLDEIKECHRRIARFSDIIGLPMSCEKIVKRIKLFNCIKFTKPVLYLEVFYNPTNEFPVNHRSMGIATSFPLRLAYELRSLEEYRGYPKLLNFGLKEEPVPELAERNVKEYLGLADIQ